MKSDLAVAKSEHDPIHEVYLAVKLPVRLPEQTRVTIPNLLTILRMVMTVIAAALFIERRLEALGIILLTAAVILDGLDGWLARRLLQCSKLGAFLDPVADKITATVVFGVIATRMSSAVIWLLFVVVILRDVIVTVSRCVRYAKTGQLLRAERIGKIKTLFQSVAGIGILAYAVVIRGDFAFPEYPVIAFLVVIAALSVVSGARYLRPKPVSIGEERGQAD